MKRFIFPAVLPLAAIALLACAAAATAGKYVLPVIPLMSIGDEPLATGQVILGSHKPGVDDEGNPAERHKVTVTCQNLTAGATYSTPAGTFTASRNGDGRITGWWYTNGQAGSWVFEVVRLDPDGSGTIVLRGSL
jgi:alkylation response protein AidB-like acyl-CoA dehydrogenase